MRLPDFLIIGAAKSGTTTLYEYLCRHPQVYSIGEHPYFTNTKEPNFFGEDEKYAKGLEYYATLFNDAKPDHLCFEASTDYTKYPEFPQSAARIPQALPQIKLIYIMRHPVDRAYSYYLHLCRHSGVKETFEDYGKKTSVCVDGSDYIIQIEQYLQYFPRESFLFLLMDDLLKNTQETLRQVFHFIGIDEQINLVEDNPIYANKGSQVFEDKIRLKITQPLLSIPVIGDLGSLLPRQYRDAIYQLLQPIFYQQTLKQEYSPPPMLPETTEMLLERFRQSNQKLSEFTGRDLSFWYYL